MNYKNRPIAITVICICGFVGGAWGLVVLFTPAAKQLERWYFTALSVSIFIGLISMLGFWKMKRWGLYLYLVMFLANNILLYSMNMWKASNVIIPLAGIAIASFYFKKMS